LAPVIHTRDTLGAKRLSKLQQQILGEGGGEQKVCH